MANMIKLSLSLDKNCFLEFGVSHRLGLLQCVTFGAGGDEPPAWLQKWLEDYQKGVIGEGDLLLDYALLSPFAVRVTKELLKVPFGKTLSYKDLATAAGSPKAYRAAATVCAKNPWPLLVPCHRVIASDGSLGGFAYGLELKTQLLHFEQTKK